MATVEKKNYVVVVGGGCVQRRRRRPSQKSLIFITRVASRAAVLLSVWLSHSLVPERTPQKMTVWGQLFFISVDEDAL